MAKTPPDLSVFVHGRSEVKISIDLPKIYCQYVSLIYEYLERGTLNKQYNFIADLCLNLLSVSSNLYPT